MACAMMSAVEDRSQTITNGLVLNMRKKYRGINPDFLAELRRCIHITSVSNKSLRRCVERMHGKFLVHQKSKNKEVLDRFLQDPFSMPKTRENNTEEERIPTKQTKESVPFNKDVKGIRKKLVNMEERNETLVDEKIKLEVQLETVKEQVDNTAAVCKLLQESLVIAEKSKMKQTKTMSDQVQHLNKKLQIKKDKIKHLTHCIKEVNAVKIMKENEQVMMEEAKTNAELNASKAEEHLCELKRKMKSTVDSCRKKVKKMSTDSKDTTITIIEMEQQVKELKLQNEELTKIMNTDIVKTFKDGRYKDEIREVIMELLAMNVSIRKVDGVIKTILKKLAGKDVEQLPSAWLKSHLLVEARSLADIQLAEVMLKGQDLDAENGHCLHGDATTKFHSKYQDFEVTMADGNTMTLGIVDQIGGDAESTFDSFMYRIKELAGAIQQGTETENTAKLLASLKTTMSDQGPINPLFNQQLKTMREDLLPVALENWGSLSNDMRVQIGSMSNFYCKMHLIVNLEEEAKKALKTFENVVVQDGTNKHSFSTSEPGAARLVRTACKAFTTRGSEEAGIPHLLEAHLNNLGLKNKMVTFCGNRVNILCVNAAAVYYHRHHIADLIHSLPNPNQLLRAVAVDAQEKAFLAGTRALGIIGKTVTGPFWRLLNNMDILGLNEHLLTMKIQFNRWSQDASSILEGESLFNEELVQMHVDDQYEELFRDSSDEDFQIMTQQALELMMASMLIVLERQAVDQLPGGKYWNPSEHLKARAANVPATNVVSERDFAVLDMLVRQKPSARILSHEAMIMWMNNGTVAWLDNLSPEEKEKKMAQARQSSADILQRYKTRREAIKRHRMDSLLQKQEQKKEKERREKNKRVCLTNSLAKLGGVWRSLAEVDNYLKCQKSDKDNVQALVTQLQFHKIVLKAEGGKELFQQSVTKDGKIHIYNCTELRQNLLEVLKINQVESEEAEVETMLEPQPAMTYRSEEDTNVRFVEEKRKLVERLNAARQKRAKKTQKDKLSECLKDTEQLVGKRVKHNCCEEGNTTPVWYAGTVLKISQATSNAINTVLHNQV